MKILTSTQFKELDRYTIEHEPIDSIQLMERAARAIADYLMQLYSSSSRFIIFAGPGNNGGDALAVARILAKNNYCVDAYLFNINGRLSPDCLINKKQLNGYSAINFTEVTSQFEFPHIEASDVIIDGLFGTGLNKPVEGGFAGVIAKINESPASTISIDLPSGLMTEDNTDNNLNAIVKADITLTIGHPKLAFFWAEYQPFIGQVETLDIGLSKEGYASLPSSISTLEESLVVDLLRPRNPFAHKGEMGHALLVSGQYGMAGATILSAQACMRSGAGKLTIHSAELNNQILQTSVPEAILSHDECDTHVSNAIATYTYNAMAIGPGLGTHQDTAEAMHQLLCSYNNELVIDADGINILGTHNNWFIDVPQETILTPHPKELENLVGRCRNSYERMTKARDFAMRLQLYIIIKGHNSMICTPMGNVIINPTGNAGMATAGSGDVLTGILLGLLSRGYSPGEACILGTYLHGLAGDLAANRLGEESLIASDIIRFLPQAFKHLYKIKKGISSKKTNNITTS